MQFTELQVMFLCGKLNQSKYDEVKSFLEEYFAQFFTDIVVKNFLNFLVRILHMKFEQISRKIALK